MGDAGPHVGRRILEERYCPGANAGAIGIRLWTVKFVRGYDFRGLEGQCR